MIEETAYPQMPEVASLIRSGRDDGVFPAAGVAVSVDGRIRHFQVCGNSALRPERRLVKADTEFDVASLTKVMATTAAAMVLLSQGKLDLDAPLEGLLPEARGKPVGRATPFHLLTHSSGLPAWKPYHELIVQSGLLCTARAREQMLSMALDEQMLAQPGEMTLYSDIGFIILAALVESIAGASLNVFCRMAVFEPMKLRRTFFIDLSRIGYRDAAMRTHDFAATEECPWRKRVLEGEVHDDNCYAAGGVCGHAGLFSTVFDTHKFALEMLLCSEGRGSFLPAEIIRQFWTVHRTADGQKRALGWDVPSGVQSAAGRYASSETVGHLGFTGCSLWIDRGHGLITVLLTNRIHPTRANEKIKEFRPRFHELVYEAVGIAGT